MLVENPQTAREYWREIEALGEFLYNANPCQDFRTPEEKAFYDKNIAPVSERSDKVVREACENFNLTHPEDMRPEKFGDPLKPPKEGTRSYWDWYREQKREALTEVYNNIICSACPLSEGVESYIATGGRHIPCKPYPGMIYLLGKPDECAMVPRWWTEDGLELEVFNAGKKRKAGGRETLEKFKAKKEQLKANPPKIGNFVRGIPY